MTRNIFAALIIILCNSCNTNRKKKISTAIFQHDSILVFVTDNVSLDAVTDNCNNMHKLRKDPSTGIAGDFHLHKKCGPYLHLINKGRKVKTLTIDFTHAQVLIDRTFTGYSTSYSDSLSVFD